MSQDKVGFVETSIQYLRLLYRPDQQRAAEVVCSEYSLTTSQTVYREFFVGMIRAVKYVSSALRERPAISAKDGMAEVLAAVADLFASDREKKRILLVLSNLSAYSSDVMTADDLAHYADGELRRLMNSGFFVFGTSYDQRIDIRKNGGYLRTLACSVAESPVENGKSRPSCNKITRSCEIRRALGESRHQLVPIAEGLRPDRKRQKDRLTEISSSDEAFFLGSAAIGERLCWPIGDVLIGLECPAGATILTTDADFETVGPVLSRDVFVYRR
jgi:hypothetical protein